MDKSCYYQDVCEPCGHKCEVEDKKDCDRYKLWEKQDKGCKVDKKGLVQL